MKEVFVTLTTKKGKNPTKLGRCFPLTVTFMTNQNASDSPAQVTKIITYRESTTVAD